MSATAIVKAKIFAVVCFDTEETAVVPITWLTPDKLNCHWPDVSGPSLLKLMTNPNSVPKSTWKLHSVQVKGKYWTLKSAREAEEKALETSTVESDTDYEVLRAGRTRQRRKQACRNESERSDSKERENANPSNNSLSLVLPEQGIFQDTFLDAGNQPLIQIPVTTLDIPDIESGSDYVVLGSLQGQEFQGILQEDSPIFPNLPEIREPPPSVATRDATTQTAQREHNERFHEVVLKRMADIQITQDHILAILARQVNGDIEEFDSLPIPCRSKPELQELEVFLREDDNRLKLERFLASIGGATLKKTVNNILQRILTDDFAVFVSFSGKGKAELAFVHFDKLHQTIFRSTRMCSAYLNSTENEINTIIMEWLRLAKDRSSGRVHKKKAVAE